MVRHQVAGGRSRARSRIDYLISFCLPRFCDQTLARAQKEHVYPGAAPWVAKLDTIVHELYHVDPSMQGIRKLPLGAGPRLDAHAQPAVLPRRHADGQAVPWPAGPTPRSPTFLTYDFVGLNARFGRVTGAAFRHFPSFPQRYVEVLADHPVDVEPGVRVERVKPPAVPTRYTAADLAVREFSKKTSRKVKQAA